MKFLGSIILAVSLSNASNVWAFTTGSPAISQLAQRSSNSYVPQNVMKAAPAITMTKSSSFALQAASSGGGEVVIDRDFRLAGIFLAAGLLLDTIPILKFLLGLPVTALGILFLVQTFRLNFVCDESTFSLENTANESGENVIVGGENRWTYDSFVNYDFFPEGWIDQPQGPILVYFKETQTPSDKWNEGPGQSANSEEAMAKGAVPGQVHFFPAICNSKQLRDEWAKRGCQKL